MVTVADVRSLTLNLERSYEAFVHGRIKFRVGQIVYVAFSRDETVMCFAFPREERAALIDTGRRDEVPLPAPVGHALQLGLRARRRSSSSRRCASWSSTRGGWSCRSSSPPPTRGRVPEAVQKMSASDHCQRCTQPSIRAGSGSIGSCTSTTPVQHDDPGLTVIE